MSTNMECHVRLQNRRIVRSLSPDHDTTTNIVQALSTALVSAILSNATDQQMRLTGMPASQTAAASISITTNHTPTATTPENNRSETV